jgi:predicted permease
LVMVQISISMVLVVGATLFDATLAKLYSIDKGLRTDGVLTFRLRTSEHYPDQRRWSSLDRLLDRLNAAPGVASASATDVIPISGSLWSRRVQVEGYSFRTDENDIAGFNAIGPKYFQTIGTPLVTGREFDKRDSNIAKKVAIVNESFARKFFGGQSPLGRRVTSVDVTYEIVGVAKDAKYTDLRQDVLKTMYIPLAQREGEQPSNHSFLVRVAAGDPMWLAPMLEKLVRDADPGLRVRSVDTYSAIIDRTLVTERIMATLGGFFGLLALIVACLGIFGIMAFQVSRRVNEIGVRIALGASRAGIVAMVLRDVASMLFVGCLVGAAVALSLTGLAKKMLFGVTPTDPTVFAAAAVVLVASAFAAAWLPARRASRVDPMVALRYE